MNIRIVITELLIFAFWAVLFIRMFLSEGLEDLPIDLVVLLSAIIIGVLLIRSVLNEIRNTEHIEQLAEALQHSNEKLRQLNRAKSEFISIASHQLRTPLSVIKGYVSMMLEGSFGKINTKLKEMLERVYVSNETLVKLVADLLDLSRIEAGRIKYNIEKIDIRDIIDVTVKNLNELAKKKNIGMFWEKPDEILNVSVDKDKFKTAFTNIVDNAVKYTEKGGVTVEVKKEVIDSNDYILVLIKDTGLGINPDEANSLFEKFSRGEVGYKANTQGLGFGLYVAKRIISDFHGQIWLKSKGKGMGTTFFIRLPKSK